MESPEWMTGSLDHWLRATMELFLFHDPDKAKGKFPVLVRRTTSRSGACHPWASGKADMRKPEGATHNPAFTKDGGHLGRKLCQATRISEISSRPFLGIQVLRSLPRSTNNAMQIGTTSPPPMRRGTIMLSSLLTSLTATTVSVTFGDGDGDGEGLAVLIFGLLTAAFGFTFGV